MNKLITCLLLTLCVGCDNREGEIRNFVVNETHCTMESSDKRAEFILQCIENANPKSDEEPEDWIRLCQRMAEDTLCPVRLMDITERCGRSGAGTCTNWQEQSRTPVNP